MSLKSLTATLAGFTVMLAVALTLAVTAIQQHNQLRPLVAQDRAMAYCVDHSTPAGFETCVDRHAR